MRQANKIARLNWMIESIQIEDLAQEGLEGLVRAINAFNDPRPETNFLSFASRYVRGRMWQYVRNGSLVKRNICNINRQAAGKIFYQLANLVDIVMTWDPEIKEEKRKEFSNKIRIPVNTILEAEKRWNMVSVPIVEEDGPCKEPYSERIDFAVLQQTVNRAISSLKEEHKYLINDRFFSNTPRTLNQLARDLGIHRNTVDQRIRYAMTHLRNSLSDSQIVREHVFSGGEDNENPSNNENT